MFRDEGLLQGRGLQALGVPEQVGKGLTLAPAHAQNTERMPVPQPTSTTVLPSKHPLLQEGQLCTGAQGMGVLWPW